MSKVNYILKLAAIDSAACTLICPILYLILRKPIWNFSLAIARIFFSLHHTDVYSGYPVGVGMLVNTMLSSILLTFGWLFANTAFSVYMTLGPSHRGELISSRSSDKNGTLVNGLQSKSKQLIRMLAFQELASIAFSNHEEDERRISIFADIDRKPTVWTQIKSECLGLLTDIVVPLQKKANKAQPTKLVPKKEEVPLKRPDLIQIKDTNVFATKNRTANIMDGFQDKNAKASKEVIGIVENLKTKTSSRARQFSSYVEPLLETELGYVLQFTVERRARQLIPNPMLTVTGVLALSALVHKSILEDPYGTVQKDIADILQKLVDASAALTAFIENPPVHWSNRKEIKQGKKEHSLENVRQVLEAVEDAFEEITVSFYQHLPNLNLSQEVIDKVNS